MTYWCMGNLTHLIGGDQEDEVSKVIKTTLSCTHSVLMSGRREEREREEALGKTHHYNDCQHRGTHTEERCVVGTEHHTESDFNSDCLGGLIKVLF